MKWDWHDDRTEYDSFLRPVGPETCSLCGEYDFRCDCLLCAHCRAAVEGGYEGGNGAWHFQRVEPAAVCCSTDCLLRESRRRRMLAASDDLRPFRGGGFTGEGTGNA